MSLSFNGILIDFIAVLLIKSQFMSFCGIDHSICRSQQPWRY